MTFPGKLIDITRELTAALPYPGDPAPVLGTVAGRPAEGGFLVQSLFCCLHNGTHMDAPLHLLPDGADAASLPLSACLGPCEVAKGLTEAPRLLLKGKRLCLKEAEKLNCLLLGTDQNSVAIEKEEEAVHRLLLEKGIVLLENLNLEQAAIGEYLLIALPLKIQGAEAAPCRALLLTKE